MFELMDGRCVHFSLLMICPELSRTFDLGKTLRELPVCKSLQIRKKGLSLDFLPIA